MDGLQIKECITDGAGDKQIDAIYIDEASSTIYVIQGKFIGSNQVDSEPLREVLSSWAQMKNLVYLQESANNKLKQKLSDLSDALQDDYDICFELITTSSLTQSAKKDLVAFQGTLSNDDEFYAKLNLIDCDELLRRYDLAFDKENPFISHTVKMPTNQYLKLELGNTNVVIAALSLNECIKLPGIKDGLLFIKNVRQSLGSSNQVNKGIKHSIYNNAKDFFFYHNGVTAICSEMIIRNEELELKGLSVVNGCQSLNTILSCSEKVKEIDPERNRADKISISTNSQSAVKPRELRSNDKKVLNLKKTFEQKYPNGYMITKRGEQHPADKDKNYVIDLSDLGKYLMAWQSQRPNISYSETKIFDKYFEQLFKKDYEPENAQALNELSKMIIKKWVKDNPLGLNESLLAMKSYAPYHHMYAVSLCFCVSNNMAEGVPNPYKAISKLKEYGMFEQIVDMAGSCLNSALEAAANEPQPNNKVFSPQNWVKTKTCLAGIRAAIRQYFSMLPSLPGGKDICSKINKALEMEPNNFEARWSAD